jgi:hypothetical protein
MKILLENTPLPDKNQTATETGLPLYFQGKNRLMRKSLLADELPGCDEVLKVL